MWYYSDPRKGLCRAPSAVRVVIVVLLASHQLTSGPFPQSVTDADVLSKFEQQWRSTAHSHPAPNAAPSFVGRVKYRAGVAPLEALKVKATIAVVAIYTLSRFADYLWWCGGEQASWTTPSSVAPDSSFTMAGATPFVVQAVHAPKDDTRFLVLLTSTAPPSVAQKMSSTRKSQETRGGRPTHKPQRKQTRARPHPRKPRASSSAVASSQPAQAKNQQTEPVKQIKAQLRKRLDACQTQAWVCRAAACSFAARYGRLRQGDSGGATGDERTNVSQDGTVGCGSSYLQAAAEGLKGCSDVDPELAWELRNIAVHIATQVNRHTGSRLTGTNAQEKTCWWRFGTHVRNDLLRRFGL